MDNNKSFSALLEDLSNSKDSARLIKTQRNTLLRYEETNEMLRQFLDLSDSTHTMLVENYTSHATTLLMLKKDLENSFKRIRTLKEKLKLKYPDAFESTAGAMKELKERHEFEDDESYRKHDKILSNENENIKEDKDEENIDRNLLDDMKLESNDDQICVEAANNEDKETAVNNDKIIISNISNENVGDENVKDDNVAVLNTDENVKHERIDINEGEFDTNLAENVTAESLLEQWLESPS